MRILKFIGVFLGTFLVIFLIVFGFNFNALLTLFENAEDIQEGKEWVAKTNSLKGLTEYIGQQPQRVSIASLALNNPDSSILYNEHTPRTMGRIASFLLAVEYLRQVEAGTLNARQQVSLKEVELYQLPFMDASGHQNALDALDDQERISDPETISLPDLVKALVRFNDLAAYDYLYFKLGKDNIEQLLDRLGMETTELPLPFSGLYITLKPDLYNRSFKQHMDSLSAMDRNEFNSFVIRQSRKLVREGSARNEIIGQFENDEGLGIQFKQQRDALALFPKTTALEMAELMSMVQQEKLISKSISIEIKELMDRLRNGGRLASDFDEYGAIYDNRLGMANGIDFGKSTYSEEPFAQAVFFDELQVAFWFHMTSNLMHQDFQQRLIWDPALRAATNEAITNNN